jgi:DNA repair exonuclease SbcCD ATPase subunit
MLLHSFEDINKRVHSEYEYSTKLETQIEILSHQFKDQESDIKKLNENKVNKQQFEEKLNNLLSFINKNTTESQNKFDKISETENKLENYMEKYLPILMQTMISNCLSYLLPPKQFSILQEYENEIYSKLNGVIEKDNGIGHIECSCNLKGRRSSKCYSRIPDFAFIDQIAMQPNIEQIHKKSSSSDENNSKDVNGMKEFMENAITLETVEQVVQSKIQILEQQLNAKLRDAEQNIDLSAKR